MADRVTRPPSSDEPSQQPRNRQARTRWRRTSGLYLTTDGGHTEAAYVDPTISLPLGNTERMAREPDKNLWRVQKSGSEEAPEYLTYRSDNGSSNVLITVPVRSTGIGVPVGGPLVADASQFRNRIAVAADGSYMVAGIDTDEVGLFVWDGEGWNATPVATLSPSPGDDILDMAISVNGDLALGLDFAPWVLVYPTTIAGFGSPYADAGSGDPDQPVVTVEWHPSGGALVWGGEGDFDGVGSGGWPFAAGYGAPYGPYDPTGYSLFPTAEVMRFAPSGDHLLIFTDSVDFVTFFPTIVPFDLTTGMGAVFTEPASGERTSTGASDEAYVAVSDTHIYTIIRLNPSTSVARVASFPYGGGAISPGTQEHGGVIETYVFNTMPMMLSRTGRFLAWLDDQNDLMHVFLVNADGSLSLIGVSMSSFLAFGSFSLGWR